MLKMVMRSSNVPPPSVKLQQQHNEKETAYTKVKEKNRPPTCNPSLLDEDEEVNTMVKYATIRCSTVNTLFIIYSFVVTPQLSGLS